MVLVSVIVFGAVWPMDLSWLLARVKNVSTVGMTTMVSHGEVIPRAWVLPAMSPTLNDPRDSAMTMNVWYAVGVLLSA